MTGNDPSTTVVMLEDAAAVVGVICAATCMTISYVTGNPTADAVGTSYTHTHTYPHTHTNTYPHTHTHTYTHTHIHTHHRCKESGPVQLTHAMSVKDRYENGTIFYKLTIWH